MSVQKLDFTLLVVIVVTTTLLAGCAASKISSRSAAWSYPIEWSSNTTVQKTASGHFVIQKGDSLIVIDGSTGEILINEIPETGGNVFSRFAKQAGEKLKEEFTFASDNPYIRTYVPLELSSVHTLLLFNLKEDEGYIRGINLATGSQNWKTTDYVWNREGARDEVNFAVGAVKDLTAVGSLAAKVALQSRNVRSMVEVLPAKDAFLFKTIKELYLIDVKSGEPIWANEDMEGTGIAGYQYLPESDQILLVGNVKGLRDALTASKQVMLIDAATGNTIWKTHYKMRSPLVKRIAKRNNRVYLYSFWGVAEVFNFKDGTRLMGTQDHTDTEGARKFKSSTLINAGKSMHVAEPQFENNYAYAVNPINYYPVGVPDWEVAKINVQTGQLVWKHKLTHSPKIKGLYLTDNKVVLRIPVQSTLGEEKKGGLYAFSKESGKLAWKLTQPFQDNMSHAYFSANTALVNNGMKTFLVDLSNGEVLKTSSFGTASDYYYPVSKNTLVSYSEEPFVVTMTKPDFSIVATDTLSTEKGGELAEWNHNYLIFKRVPMFGDVDITAYNHTTHKKAGNFSIEQERGTTYAHGLYLVDDKIVLMREEALVAYDLY